MQGRSTFRCEELFRDKVTHRTNNYLSHRLFAITKPQTRLLCYCLAFVPFEGLQRVFSAPGAEVMV